MENADRLISTLLTLITAKSAFAERAEIDDRFRRAPLLPVEQHEARHREGGEHRRLRPRRAQPVQRQQHETQCQRQQRAAGGIERFALTAGRAGQGPGQHKRRGGDRCPEAEHRAPAEAFDQRPEHRRPQRAADAEHHHVPGEDLGAHRLGEQAGGQCRAAAQDQAGADALGNAAGEQGRRRWGPARRR